MALEKRFFLPTSPVFSLIAVRNGTRLQSSLVKFNGSDLILDNDDKAFFGRIKALNGYVLNIPFANGTTNVTYPSTRNVHVGRDMLLSSTNRPLNSTGEFGILNSLLTYKNSTQFLVCSEPETNHYALYARHGNTTCPSTGNSGYIINLLVQVAAHVNYNPESNRNSIFRRFASRINL